MTWSYSGDPTTSAKDEVRFLVGDTDDSSDSTQLVSDEEIAYVIGMHTDPGAAYGNYVAAAVIAQGIAAKFAQKADKTVGSLSLNYSQKFDHYTQLAETLRGFARTGPAGSVVGAPKLGGGGQTYLGNDFS